ncbi:MAG TPA: cysteine-rich CWC family protein [Spirochaetota bacterium]|nr:cysteine-rich CWC family protein [Spirochaetota bacterium]HPI88953.1 cysteine-rich CWC family protein [Spirochaetota bacterium]HPR46570.1 cysteine-rich CWC family protein [Spirochaetota bacterium]
MTTENKINEKICPLCGRPNRCGERPVVNGKTMERCWCAYETFPPELLSRVPDDKRMKACICSDCLRKFKNEKN